MRKMMRLGTMCLGAVLLLSLVFTGLASASSGDGDPIPVSEFGNRDWETYNDVRLAYNDDNYGVKYPLYLGEAHTIEDVVTPYYNGGSNTVTRKFTESNSETYTASTSVEVSYNVGFEFEGFSTGYDVSTSYTTTHSTSTTTSNGIEAPVSPGNTLYVYAEGVYNVETGQMLVYDRTGSDANTWEEWSPYHITSPIGALVGTDEVPGSHYEPYWQYLANDDNLWSERIWPAGEKYYNHLGGWDKTEYELTKRFSWSKPHNTDGNNADGVYTVGMRYDWNLSSVYDNPDGFRTHINGVTGIYDPAWQESSYKFQ